MWRLRVQTLWVLGALCLFGDVFLAAQTERTVVMQGAQRFMEYCAGCHGADAKGGDKAPPLVSASNRMTPSDEELIRIVREGTTDGMPPFAQIGDANITSVVRYLRLLEDSATSPKTSAKPGVTGDTKAGRELYFGKARCSTCHVMGGVGGFIGAALTTYGRNRTADAILNAITAPDSPLEPSSRVVRVTEKTGRSLTGILRNEDAFNLAIQTEDGRYHLLARRDLKDVHYTENSLMPRDYGTLLMPKELNDIVSFMIEASQSLLSDAAQDR